MDYDYLKFNKYLKKEIQAAIDGGWILKEDFDTHESSQHSDFHAKLIGLISYVLQYHFGYYVKHEARLWGGFIVDLIAFRKCGKKFEPTLLIEYESPNSYLHREDSHVGKDICHYFEYQKKCHESKLSKGKNKEYLLSLATVDWYLITTLPRHDVTGEKWNHKHYLDRKSDHPDFMTNPFNHMLPRYKKLYNNKLGECRRPAKERNRLYYLNMSVEKDEINLKKYSLT